MATNLRLNGFLLCDSVIRDANSGKETITGIFDRIYASGFPAVHGTMSAYFRLSNAKPNETLNLELQFTSPSGLSQRTPSLPVQADQRGGVRGSVVLNGFPLESAGDYRFDLLVDGESIGEYVITVEKLKSQGATDAVVH